MENIKESELVRIQSLIYEIRGYKVMVDRDLAKLYGVETKVLNQAVKRNIKRFPEDFMFQFVLLHFYNFNCNAVRNFFI